MNNDVAPKIISGIGDQLTLGNILAIVVLIIIGVILQKILPSIVHRLLFEEQPLAHKHLSSEDKKRRDTMVNIIGGVSKILLWFLVGLAILSQLGVNIGPFLAGAGVAGVALGFGAQYLVKDIIAGAFIVSENQYRVGDIVKINDITGTVEDVRLRVTILRDLDGVKHFIPNGTPDMTSNLTYQFSGINLDIGVDYDTDIEKVIKVINSVGEDMMQDKVWEKEIVSKPVFERVEDFADSAIIVKITGKTKPLRQWAVAGELRKRLKIAFDREGIVIPFPQRVIHNAK